MNFATLPVACSSSGRRIGSRSKGESAMRFNATRLIVTAICLTTCPAAIAQTQPAGPIVATADLAAPEKDLGDERKYWVLHKP
ncbi:MAG: hypothetical protein ACKOPG_01085, partial [Novosphingobium sp.]